MVKDAAGLVAEFVSFSVGPPAAPEDSEVGFPAVFDFPRMKFPPVAEYPAEPSATKSASDEITSEGERRLPRERIMEVLLPCRSLVVTGELSTGAMRFQRAHRHDVLCRAGWNCGSHRARCPGLG